MALINRSHPVCWELMPLEGTANWRRHVTQAIEIGFPVVLLVQAFEKGGSSAQVNEETDCGEEGEEGGEEGEGEGAEEGEEGAEEGEEGEEGADEEEEAGVEVDDELPFEGAGEIDEGEENPEVLRQYNREAEDDERALEEDSSDDEDDVHVPAHWQSYDFSQLTVNPGQDVPWEYRENEVSVGAMYSNAGDLKDAVKGWATLTLQREFRVAKSSPHIYDVCCVNPDCPFRVHAYKGKWKDYWEVTIVVEHTCVLQQLDASHRNMSAGFVANHMYSQIVENPAYEPKSIICAIEEKFKFEISYGKAYRAKKKVLEMRWGNYEASYHNLPALMNTICRLNPGSYYDVKTYPCVAKPGKHVLQRSFLALGPCIEAFRHCRPVICIDGTFLTGKYKGTILTAVAADGNNQLLPLAIAFAEGENGDSWYWFLERLKLMVIKDIPNVCVIHDRHKGILQAINDIKDGSEERNRAALWPDVQSRWCIRHMGANFHSQFKNKDLTKLFKRLCEQNQERKFNEIWKKLDELTKKASEEFAKKPVNPEPGQEPVSLEDVGLDGPTVRRRRGRNVKTFSQWIEHEPKEKWTLMFDTGGARHGIKTTNFAEVYNWVLRGARALPLVGIIEFFLYRTMKYFLERSNAAHKAMADVHKVYSTKMTEYLDKAQKKALLHRATPAPLHRASSEAVQWKYDVQCKVKSKKGGRERRLQTVLIGNETCKCSCQKPQLLHRPCTHVIAASYVIRGWHHGRYVPWYYFKATVLATWNHTLEGYLFLGSFTQDPKENATYIPDPDPEMCQGVGRRKKKRIRNNMDAAEAGPSVQICSKCNNPGHSYKKCTAPHYACNAPPSSNVSDAAAPSGRGRGRRSRRYNEGMQ